MTFTRTIRVSIFLIPLIMSCRSSFPLNRFFLENPAPTLRVGEKALDFSIPSNSGSTFTLSSLHGKNSIVLVFFRKWW